MRGNVDKIEEQHIISSGGFPSEGCVSGESEKKAGHQDLPFNFSGAKPQRVVTDFYEEVL